MLHPVLCCCSCSMPVSQDMNAPQWMQEQTGRGFSDVNTREASKPGAVICRACVSRGGGGVC